MTRSQYVAIRGRLRTPGWYPPPAAPYQNEITMLKNLRFRDDPLRFRELLAYVTSPLHALQFSYHLKTPISGLGK